MKRVITFGLLFWISILSTQGQVAATATDTPTPATPVPAATGDAVASAPAGDAPKAGANQPPAATSPSAPAAPIAAAIKAAPERDEVKTREDDTPKSPPERKDAEITDWLIAAGGLLIGVCACIQIGWMKRTEKAISAQARWMEGTEGVIRQQAEALGKTVAAIGDAAEKELRAYLAVKLEPANGLDPLYTESMHPYRAFFDFKLTIQNFGKTPAYDVRFAGGNSGIFPLPLPADWNEIKPVDRTTPGVSVSLGGGEIIVLTVEKQFYSQEELMEFTNLDAASRRIYAYGRIDYRDVFGKQRFTEYCVALIPTPGSIVLRILSSDKGNEAE